MKVTKPRQAVAWDYVHPNLRPYLRNNTVEKKLFDYGPEGFDLYSVSAVIKINLLKRITPTERLSQDFQFLHLLANDLENPTAGLPEFTLFSAEDGLRAILQYRSNKKLDRKSIRLSTGITVGISSLAQEIIDTPEFQRLRRITQLSLTHLVYPECNPYAVQSFDRCILHGRKVREGIDAGTTFSALSIRRLTSNFENKSIASRHRSLPNGTLLRRNSAVI